MKTSLEALLKNHYCRIIFETDSSSVANAMQRAVNTVDMHSELILECINLKAMIWNATVNYIHRNYNVFVFCVSYVMILAILKLLGSTLCLLL